MSEPDRPVGLRLFGGLPFRGCIDGDQPVIHGKAHHETGGAEIALDEHEVSRVGGLEQPLLERGEQRLDLRRVRWDLAPERLQTITRPDDPLDAERITGIGHLFFREVVIEEKQHLSSHGNPLFAQSLRSHFSLDRRFMVQS
jgi:hypothetical protein